MPSLLIALALMVGTADADTTYLYKALFVRAAPGELVSLIELYEERMPVFEAGAGRPFVLRHRQGDQWDVFYLFPMESFERYWSEGQAARRAAAAAGSPRSDHEFERLVLQRVAWREELYVKGPALETVRAALEGGTLFHLEAFIAVPGKRAELLREREMENAYLAAVGRPTNLIFTRAAGAAWDSFTIGVYRDLAHYAEGDAVPAEEADAAARAAGFEAADRIGTYLRTLMSSHHDTIGRIVR
ncbi:MAG: hypothetical protein JSW43_08440 [Gemmatimonadota bacterium]|nr:MAG: hypothetical protein JSW43_08440 [Gemmatimonadota bacterium]